MTWQSCASRPHTGECEGVGDLSDVNMIGGKGLLAKDPTIGIVCIRVALILGRARVLLQKCRMRGLPPATGWPMCVGRACGPRTRVGRIRVVVSRAGGIRNSFVF